MPDRAAELERLISAAHDLLFDIQECRTPDDETFIDREGRRIAAALRRLFDG